jgi:hypothetical protein
MRFPRIEKIVQPASRLANVSSVVTIMASLQRKDWYCVGSDQSEQHHHYHISTRGSSVGRALGYGLYDRGSRFRFPAGAVKFSHRHRVQYGSRAHPAFYSMGTRGSFPEGKAVRAWRWPLTSI